MNTKAIIETLNIRNMHPNKKFGQNFLCNDGILKRIIEAAGINKNDSILEIGPGLGDLTALLADNAGSVTAVEIDAGLYQYLAERFHSRPDIILLHNDFLKIDITGKFTKAVSNLPYYCSSEILFHLALKYRINEIFVMLQKEMCERIISRPGSKNYGALTVSLGLYYKGAILFNIDKKSFYPQPDVSSSFLYLKREQNIPLSPEEEDLFHRIVKSLFWGRRKTIRKGLSESPHINLNKNIINIMLEKLNISENTRGENLEIAEFSDIARTIYLLTK